MEQNINFIDFKTSFDTLKHKVVEIPYDELTFLWIGDFYDGMLDGMLEYQNQKYRFEIITDYTKNIYPRLFAIIILSESEIKEEEYWNELFEKYVGNHNNLTTTEDRILKPVTEFHLFYDEFKKREKKGYDTNIIKGWYIG